MYEIDFAHPVRVHFIGIGGISMSGLAKILLDRGFRISGSDNTPSDLTRGLEAKGIRVMYPQKAENVTDDIELVVYTAAIHPDNPEFAACEKAGLPMLTRAQLLGQIMRHYDRSTAVAGTHGKTTTTGMIGQILLAGEEEPTISIGGILPAIGGNIHVGNSDLFLTEACEYTNSYHHFFPKYNVILNVEEDHMDFFKDLEDIRASFRKFAGNTASDGVLVINHGIERLGELTEGLPCRVVTFGAEDDADYYPADVRVDAKGITRFTVMERTEDDGEAVSLGEVSLSVPGMHNVLNALASFAVTKQMGIPTEQIRRGLADFHGTGRRFEYKGDYHGATLYDDYAHHPTEIAATLAAAESLPHRRLVVVFQPHTYTRTKAFLQEFAEVLSRADIVGLCPVYPAREEDIYGVHSEDIKGLIDERIEAKIPDCRAKECHCFGTFEEAKNFLKKISSTGDLLITMGAGDVVKVGEMLLNP